VGSDRDDEPNTPAIVDVGIPTRGEGRYLQDAIESVLAQTFTRWRLVVSDNGAQPGRAEATVASYLGDRRVIYSPTRAELSAAANYTRLVRAGAARYVGILHDDDRWHPSFLERRVDFLERHQECGFVFSGTTIIDGDGRPRGATPLPFRCEGVVPSAELVAALYLRNVVPVPSVVVRRSAYDGVGAAYSERVAFVDYDMWLRLASNSDAGFLATYDNDYRIHPGQASSRERLRLASRRLEVLEALQDMLPLSEPVRRRAHRDALLACALDATERGERREALTAARRALELDGRMLLRGGPAARVAAVLVGSFAGPRVRRAIGRVRTSRFETHGAQSLGP
jgi:glycosyltransferase involved in cell wall biosynthesis